jgi:hypothetical protein
VTNGPVVTKLNDGAFRRTEPTPHAFTLTIRSWQGCTKKQRESSLLSDAIT